MDRLLVTDILLLTPPFTPQVQTHPCRVVEADIYSAGALAAGIHVPGARAAKHFSAGPSAQQNR